MNFNRSFSGTTAAVLAALTAFAGQQLAEDKQNNAPVAEAEGHQAQIEHAEQRIAALLEDVPASATVVAGIHGDAHGDGSGAYGFSVSVSGLVSAIVVEEPATPKS